MARNGRWRGSSSIPVSSVGGPSEIVSWSAPGSEEIAAKAIPALVKKRACCSATGATIRAESPSSGKKRSKRVADSLRTAATGFRFENSGSRLEIASLSEVPRPAKPEP